jgi:flap endonuclease-1
LLFFFEFLKFFSVKKKGRAKKSAHARTHTLSVMGIKDLYKVICDTVPGAVKEDEIKNYFGRKIAIDASMSLYQFLISIRGADGATTLTDSAGEATSHILGMFYRTIRMLVNGIKPCYVFDGKPPTLKTGELARRSKRAKEAKEEFAAAKEEGDADEAAKQAKRTTRVSKEQADEVKRLMCLMGVPVVEAPCEAEAQCAALARAGLVWAVGTEDMDALTFGAPILLRHLNYAESRKEPILEIHLDRLLAGLGFTMDQFVDLSILLGCDYMDTIRGIGRVRALELMQRHRSMEQVLKTVDRTKHPVPESFPYEEVREMFRRPEIADPATIELKWGDPDEAGLVQYLVKEKGFNEERVLSGIAKLKRARTTTVQGRLDTFFKPVAPPDAAAASTSSTSSTPAGSPLKKRKTPDAKASKSKKNDDDDISFSKLKKKKKKT